MALTARERKQKQLAREQEELRKLPDSTYDFLGTPFHVAVQDDPNWSNVSLSFELMGLEPPAFENDRGPADFAHEQCFATDDDRADAFEGFCGSIGRAEAMVDFLLDASIELAGVINTYKKQALRDHRQQIESSDLSDPEARREALATIARLTRIEDALDKNVRRTLPQWKVKGL